MAWSVHLHVTLMHDSEAKCQNQISFGRDTYMYMAPSNSVLDRVSYPY